ncbi:uncharacterized protein LOC110816268 [Carica papaya]|uniref:uncharacterized protein LOC110816268 n=1 Tax=Carica papaya TaxID=3649 RepID=UPI000B8C923F|nr:uncharacterized protein LOC110816268 [Carica papaya]
MPERYEATITTLENTKEFSKITLVELLNALQAQDQRRLMRQESVVEGALPAKHLMAEKTKKNTDKKTQATSSEGSANNQNRNNGRNSKKNYPPCQHYGKIGHPPFKYWRRPDAKCSKCGQDGHKAVVRNNKFQNQDEAAQVADEEKDRMFVVTCFSTKSSSEGWLIDSGCPNHMTFDKTLFKDLRPSKIKKIKIGNGGYLPAKGTGTVAITTSSEKMTISRDAHFNEDEQWDWKNLQEKDSYSKEPRSVVTKENLADSWQEELEDDLPVRGTRSISDIYVRCNVAICELDDREEAVQDSTWKKTMEEELFMITKNKTWELIKRPEGRKVVGVKWVFRTKLNADSSINKHKARLVIKGYAQIYGVDYSDTFAPVARLDTIRLLLALSAQMGWKVF